MIRISGVNLPENKKIDISLTTIKGIGRASVIKILAKAEVDPAKKAKDLNSDEITRIQKVVDQFPVEGILRKQVSENIQRLKSIGSYRGLRHLANLPVRGQRTRSNARTKRGKRLTIGAMKKDNLAKAESTKG